MVVQLRQNHNCKKTFWSDEKLTITLPATTIGLASADVTAERDAWKRIATGKTGSIKQR